MSLAYLSYEAQAVNYAINMIAGSAVYTAFPGKCVRRDKSANYFDETESLTGATWTRTTGLSPVPGVADPSGGTTGWTIEDLDATGIAALSQTQRMAAGKQLISFQAKADTSPVIVVFVTRPDGTTDSIAYALDGSSLRTSGAGVNGASTVSGNGFRLFAFQFTNATAGDTTISFRPAQRTTPLGADDPTLTGRVFFCRPMWEFSLVLTPSAYVSVPSYTYLDTVVESVGGLTQNTYKSLGGTSYADNFFRLVAVVDPSSPAIPQEIALHTYGYSGTIDVGWNVYVDPLDTPAESLRRVRNTIGAIRADIEAQFGQPSCLQRGTVRLGQIYLLDETRFMSGYAFVPMTIDWTSP